jgi:hypothetical protein
VRRAGSIAIALHDVEPATFERCAGCFTPGGARRRYDSRTGAGLAARGVSGSALAADLASA